MNRDTAGVQSNLKRDGVGDIRHKAVKNLFNNPWREKEDNAFQNALPENPYSNLTVPGKEQDEEDLEEPIDDEELDVDSSDDELEDLSIINEEDIEE